MKKPTFIEDTVNDMLENNRRTLVFTIDEIHELVRYVIFKKTTIDVKKHFYLVTDDENRTLSISIKEGSYTDVELDQLAKFGYTINEDYINTDVFLKDLVELEKLTSKSPIMVHNVKHNFVRIAL